MPQADSAIVCYHGKNSGLSEPFLGSETYLDFLNQTLGMEIKWVTGLQQQCTKSDLLKFQKTKKYSS